MSITFFNQADNVVTEFFSHTVNVIGLWLWELSPQTVKSCGISKSKVIEVYSCQETIS